MATQRQIEANRQNALKSTGPRTPEGKAASSMNALKSGLDAKSQHVPGESREEFAQLQQDYFERYAPTAPEQRFLLDTIIRNEWLLRRLHRVEGELWAFHARQAEKAYGMELGESFSRAGADFTRLERRIRAAEKACKEALATLRRLQAESQPEQTNAETSKLGSFSTAGLQTCPVPTDSPAPPEPPAVSETSRAGLQTCPVAPAVSAAGE